MQANSFMNPFIYAFRVKKGVLFTTFVMVYRKVKEFRQQLLIYLDVIEVSFTHN